MLVVFPIFKPPISSLVSPDLPLYLDSTIDKPSSLYSHIDTTKISPSLASCTERGVIVHSQLGDISHKNCELSPRL